MAVGLPVYPGKANLKIFRTQALAWLFPADIPANAA
jgi:hypothetical protein